MLPLSRFYMGATNRFAHKSLPTCLLQKKKIWSSFRLRANSTATRGLSLCFPVRREGDNFTIFLWIYQIRLQRTTPLSWSFFWKAKYLPFGPEKSDYLRPDLRRLTPWDCSWNPCQTRGLQFKAFYPRKLLKWSYFFKSALLIWN